MSRGPRTPTVPVVLQLWKRLERLPRVLERLVAQQGVRVELHLLNSDADNAAIVDEMVSAVRARLEVRVTHGDNELACFRRFHYSAAICDRHPFVVFIDDDQEFGPAFVRTLWEERTREGISGCYTYDSAPDESYWQRTVPAPGGSANYCGPGGMIIDSKVLGSEELQGCPADFRIVDDLWLSFVADHRLRAPMFRSSARVRMTDATNDTYRTIRTLKAEVFEALREDGWDA